MRVPIAIGILCLGLIAPMQVPGPNLDFERGLSGWTATGHAFDGQPREVAALEATDDSVPISLGGDYWRGVRYPIGASGAFAIRSSVEGTGTLVSGDIPLRAGDRYFSLLVGGDKDEWRASVELQIRVPPPASSLFGRDGDYVIVERFTGSGADRLRQETREIDAALRGYPARIKIVDDASDKHIGVDGFQFTADPPAGRDVPVWGIADLHTHPMSHMAFGALQDPSIRTMWGVPGESYDKYVADPHLVSRDIPECMNRHGGGPTAEVLINVIEGRAKPPKDLLDYLKILRALKHKHSGGPSFKDYPSFQSGLHEQMHITEIHRAWEGGLRLMVALAVDNEGVEFLMSPSDIKALTPEKASIEAQICGMRQLAKLNSSWMSIAYSPQEARDIIEQNKLAIVVGVETDRLGELNAGAASSTPADPSAAIDEEIDYLWRLGVRQVTPIHAIDNVLGGAAIFQPVYSWQNDFVHRGKQIATAAEVKSLPTHFFEPREGSCDQGPLQGLFGECVTYRLNPTQSRPVLTKAPEDGGRPFLTDADAPGYAAFGGMMNARGLTAEGREYIARLMRRGIVVGLEHMSQQSVEDVYSVVAGILVEQGHPECRMFGREPLPACDALAYPLMMSHAHFRELSIADRDKTTVEGFRPSEYEAGIHETELIRRTGGIAGQFVAEDPVIPPASMPLPPNLSNDCGGSSKSFAVSLFYAMQRLDGHVALASDFTIIGGTSPRFGEHQCWAYRAADNPDQEKSLLPSQYKLTEQQDGVVYDVYATQPPKDKQLRASLGHNPPLKAFTLDQRQRPFDINLDGFAHYGLLPDLLQDVKNVGMPHETFESLFSSAESYIRTWEKVGRVMQVEFPRGFSPRDPNCQAACKGLCPESPNAGAPIRR